MKSVLTTFILFLMICSNSTYAHNGSPDDEKPVNFSIRILDEELKPIGVIEITAYPSTPARDLSIAVAKKEKVPISAVKLIFAGKPLKDYDKISDFYRSSNSVVTAIILQSKLKNSGENINKFEDTRKFISELKNKEELRKPEVIGKIFSYDQPPEFFISYIIDLHQKGYFMKDDLAGFFYRKFSDTNFLMNNALLYMKHYKFNNHDEALAGAIAYYITKARILEDTGKRPKIRFFSEAQRKEFIAAFDKFSPIKFDDLLQEYKKAKEPEAAAPKTHMLSQEPDPLFSQLGQASRYKTRWENELTKLKTTPVPTWLESAKVAGPTKIDFDINDGKKTYTVQLDISPTPLKPPLIRFITKPRHWSVHQSSGYLIHPLWREGELLPGVEAPDWKPTNNILDELNRVHEFMINREDTNKYPLLPAGYGQKDIYEEFVQRRGEETPEKPSGEEAPEKPVKAVSTTPAANTTPANLSEELQQKAAAFEQERDENNSALYSSLAEVAKLIDDDDVLTANNSLELIYSFNNSARDNPYVIRMREQIAKKLSTITPEYLAKESTEAFSHDHIVDGSLYFELSQMAQALKDNNLEKAKDRLQKLYERYGKERIQKLSVISKYIDAALSREVTKVILAKAEAAVSAQDPLKQLFAKADSGDAKAQYELANKYAVGVDVPQNEKLAFKYFKLAADHGNEYAMYQVGNRYSNAIGVERNPAEAFRYLKMALDKGVEEAEQALVLEATEKENPEASHWLQEYYSEQ